MTRDEYLRVKTEVEAEVKLLNERIVAEYSRLSLARGDYFVSRLAFAFKSPPPAGTRVRWIRTANPDTEPVGVVMDISLAPQIGPECSFVSWSGGAAIDSDLESITWGTPRWDELEEVK